MGAEENPAEEPASGGLLNTVGGWFSLNNPKPAGQAANEQSHDPTGSTVEVTLDAINKQNWTNVRQKLGKFPITSTMSKYTNPIGTKVGHKTFEIGTKVMVDGLNNIKFNGKRGKVVSLSPLDEEEPRYWVKVSDTFMYRRRYHKIKKENITSSLLVQAFGIRDGARLTHPGKLNLPVTLRDTLLKKIHYIGGDFKSDLIHKEAGTFETGLYGSSETWWRDFVKLQQAGRLTKLEFVKVDCSMCKGKGITGYKGVKCRKCNGYKNSWKKRTDGQKRGSGALGEDSEEGDKREDSPDPEDSEDFVPRRRLGALETRFQRVRDFQAQTEI